jgi:hypothetical protein
METMEGNLRREGWITTAEAAKLMGVRWKYVHYLTFLGKLTCQKVSNSNWYREQDILAYIESHPRLGKRVKTA